MPLECVGYWARSLLLHSRGESGGWVLRRWECLMHYVEGTVSAVLAGYDIKKS